MVKALVQVDSDKKAKQPTLVVQNKRFINVVSPVTETLRGVWLESRTVGFAVGNAGTIIKYDGDKWVSMTSPTGTRLNKVNTDTLGVIAPNTIGGWAVGQSGVIVYYDTGTEAWVLDPQSGIITTENLNGILIYDANTDVFAVGDNGTILYWDGTSWTALASGTTETLLGITYDDNGDLWVCGTNGILLESTDWVTWTAIASGVTKRLNYIWFTVSRDVGYAVGADGIILSIIPSTNTVSAISSGLPTGMGSMLFSIEITSEMSGFVVGNAGNILFWDGNNFYESPSPTQYALADVAGTSVNVVFAVGVDGIILKLMSDTYGTTLESRGVEITPLKEEYEESQIFTDYAITDTNPHNSSIFNASRYKFVTFYIMNTHNQVLTVQVTGNRLNSTTGAVNVSTTFTVAATVGIEFRTFTIDNVGYLPYYFIEVSAAIAPLSGDVNTYAIGRN